MTAPPLSLIHILCACVDAPVEVAPRALVSIPTGIAIALPSAEYVALVFARSGLGIKHGIALSNGVGVIDSDYRGEIRVGLTNLSDTPYTVQPGDRIAQLAVMPVVQAELELSLIHILCVVFLVTQNTKRPQPARRGRI